MKPVNAESLKDLKFRLPEQFVDIGDYTFRVVGLSEADRIEFDLWLRSKDGEVSNGKLAASRIKLISLCVRDDQGSRVFSESNFEQLKAFPSFVTARLAEASQRLCGLTDDDLGDEVKN